MINVRTKGQDGEREVARDLNAIIDGILAELGLPAQDPAKPMVQRNQNQSAVGGCDLTGTFELAIEIKRQETLSINTWWAQCVKSAQELNQRPVLIFRQNTPGGGRKLWRVIMEVELQIPGWGALDARAEITYDDFKMFFTTWAREALKVENHMGVLKVVKPEPVKDPLPDLYAA